MPERERLRTLAKICKEAAADPVMEERRSIWRGMNSMRPIRPAVMVETATIRDFVEKNMLQCTDPYLRNIEKTLLEAILHYQEIPDDFVVENELLIPYDVAMGDFGYRIVTDRPEGEEQIAYHFRHPISHVEQTRQLHPRTFHVDRESSIARRDRLNEIFGDILPVRVCGIDPERSASSGYTPFNGQYVTCISLNLFIHLGMETICYWLMDEFETIDQLLGLFTQDFIDFHRFLEREGLLADNRCNMLTGGHFGYLEEPPEKQDVKLDTQWIWCNYEELTSVSPEIFHSLIHHLARAAEIFGHTYYACCDRIDDRYEIVEASIPHLKAVSVSAFSDVFVMGEKLAHKSIIYSRKPKPWLFAEENIDWALVETDIKDVKKAAKDCNYEFLLRDVYDIFGDRTRLAHFVDIAKNI